MATTIEPHRWRARLSHVSVREDYERRIWAQYLDVSEKQLQAAVAAVGHSIDKVKEYLNQQKLREYLKRYRRASLSR